MSLYRKYRPLTFSDLVGQQHIVKTLENALEQNRLAHAFLFSGPRGTGKTTTARILAKALLCEKGPSSTPDGTCGDCELIAEGRHPDVLELDAASQTGVDNVREEIISRLGYAPSRGQYKIYLIDEVHMLSTGAFNAMLKTLEEPPAHVVFILCTTNPQSVPETIRSRCQRFDFRPIPTAEIAQNLQVIVDKEGASADKEALTLIARHAQGGMRDAITSLEQLISYTAGNITTAEVEQTLGEISSDSLFELMSFVAERKSAEALYWVADQVERGSDLIEVLRSLTAYMRDVYVLKIVEDSEALVDIGPEELISRKNLSLLFEGPERLMRILTMLADAAGTMRYSTEPRMVFELALIRMIQPEGETNFEAYAERLERLEAKILQGFEVHSSVSEKPTAAVSGKEKPSIPTETLAPIETEQAPATPSSVSSQSCPSVSSVEREWRRVLEHLRKVSPGRAIAFDAVQARIASDGTLVLAWPKEQDNYYSAIKADRALIESALIEVFGTLCPYKLELGQSASQPKQEPAASPIVEAEVILEPEKITEPEPSPEPVVESEPEQELESVLEPEPKVSVNPVELGDIDEALSRSLEFLGAQVAEVRSLNGEPSKDALTEKEAFIEDPEESPSFTQDSIF